MSYQMNAKDELLDLIAASGSELLCLHIHTDDSRGEPDIDVRLYPRYTQEQYEAALAQLDFTYDDGYGSQYLFGYVWFTDGSWAERGEYDGSEWWEHKVRPTMTGINEQE